MKLRAAGFLLLVTWSDMGLTKNMGDYESLAECQQAWKEQVACWREELKNKDNRLKDWGQPLGFCLQGERLSAPGIIFPRRKEVSSSCG